MKKRTFALVSTLMMATSMHAMDNQQKSMNSTDLVLNEVARKLETYLQKEKYKEDQEREYQELIDATQDFTRLFLQNLSLKESQ